MLGGLLNGVEDPCEAYYTAAMVDPAFEVGPITAIVETFTVCLVVPARACGECFGSFYTQLLQPLPYIWKIPVLVLATLVLMFLMLLLCGYEFKIPFLLSVRPSRRRKESSKSARVKGNETLFLRQRERSPQLSPQSPIPTDHGAWIVPESPDTRPSPHQTYQD